VVLCVGHGAHTEPSGDIADSTGDWHGQRGHGCQEATDAWSSESDGSLETHLQAVCLAIVVSLDSGHCSQSAQTDCRCYWMVLRRKLVSKQESFTCVQH